jgi:hypothetical protein
LPPARGAAIPMGALVSLVGPSSRAFERALSPVLAGLGLSDLWGADGPLCCVAGPLPALVIAPPPGNGRELREGDVENTIKEKSIPSLTQS